MICINFCIFLGLPLRPSALGRALSWLAGLLGPAVFSLRSKTWVCGYCRTTFHPSADSKLLALRAKKEDYSFSISKKKGPI